MTSSQFAVGRTGVEWRTIEVRCQMQDVRSQKCGPRKADSGLRGAALKSHRPGLKYQCAKKPGIATSSARPFDTARQRREGRGKDEGWGMKAERRSAERCAASRQFAGRTRYTRWPFRRSCPTGLTLVLPAGWATIDCRQTKGRGRPLGSFRVSFRTSFGSSSEMSFELSFQKSFDVSFRRSFAASDVRSDALSFEMSDARSDEASFEMSDEGSDEVGLRISLLVSFRTTFLTSFPASFQGSFQDSGEC